MPIPPLHTVRDTLLPRALVPLVPGAIGRARARAADGRERLYLTVDDGPHPDGTPRLLQALARHGARATMFLSGPAAQAHPGLVREIVAAGHTVGSHGWAHESAWRRGTDLGGHERAAAMLEDATGAPCAGVRPPYGRVTPALVRWARRRGLPVVLWDLMPGDFLASATADGVARALRRYRRAGSIAVLHDCAPAACAARALGLALPALLADGVDAAPLTRADLGAPLPPR